jgi:ankyrin repeat protein
MSAHKSLIKLFVKLGYKETPGVCYGMSIRWLEACFLGEEYLFDARIKRIERIVSLGVDIVHKINALKAKKGKGLTQDDKELFDLLAFFDSLELYQDSDQHSDLFNLPYFSSQENCTFHSYFASSDKILSMGGLAQIYSEPMILTNTEITKYLEDLGMVLQKNSVPTDTFGVLLDGSGHTIALNYNPKVGWGFMDINQYPAKFYYMDAASAVKIIAKKIMTGLDFNKKGGPIAFNASVITTQNNPSLSKLKTQLEQFKAGHVVTENIASREQDGVGLAYIAARNGHSSVITELAQHNADLNKVSDDGLTPAIIAAQNGHVSAIVELAKHNADLSQASNEGKTPAYVAAEYGHVSVIKELAKYKLNLDKANKNGHTPTYIAAQNGHVSAIAELAKHKVDLNKSSNDGVTPAIIAAYMGHVGVIAELAKHKVDLDKADNTGWTPAQVAAQYGHVFVLEELAKHNVDLNKISSCVEKTTALHLAVKKGHINCARLLIKAGSSLMVKDSYLKTPLDYAVEKNNKPLIELMKNSLKESQKKEILDKLEIQLCAIKNKAKELKQRKFDAAYTVARNLYKNLLEYKNQCSKNEIDYPQFKEQSLTAIKEARTKLEKHRGWKEVLANIVYCVVGLGVFYLGACWYKGSFFKFKTDSEKKLDLLKHHIEETASALPLI